MSDPHHTQRIPRGVLLGAAMMILLSIGLAAAARRAHLREATVLPPPPLRSIELRFADRPDGAIAVLAADTGRPVSQFAPRTNGFVRGVLRGLFRVRKLESLDRDGRFRLAREASGRLSLTDLQTGRRVDLDSFGPTNAAAFAQILEASPSPSETAP